jgi:hypothetical protein
VVVEISFTKEADMEKIIAMGFKPDLPPRWAIWMTCWQSMQDIISFGKIIPGNTSISRIFLFVSAKLSLLIPGAYHACWCVAKRNGLLSY